MYFLDALQASYYLPALAAIQQSRLVLARTNPAAEGTREVGFDQKKINTRLLLQILPTIAQYLQ